MKKRLMTAVLAGALTLTMSCAALAAGDTLTIAMAGDLPSLKGGQNSRTTASLVWPTLFTLQETDNGGYEYVIDEHSIVESADWSDDKQSLEIKLKEGVQMHDGTTLDADDVVFSIALESQSANYLNGNPNLPDDGSGVEKIDDNTVKLTFNTVSVNNWNLAAQMRIFSKEAYEASGAEDLVAYGCDQANFASYGPYKMADFVAGDSMTLEKFDDYFAENNSEINKVVVRRIDEANVAMMELTTGGVDVVMYPAQADIADVDAGMYPDIKKTAAAGLYQQLAVFNLDAGSKCADANVRKALCYAMDREAMWEGAFESSGLLATTPVSMTQEFAKEMDDPYPQDLDKCKELLEEAGLPEGTVFTVCVDNDIYRTTAVEMLKNNLNSIGYDVEIKTGDNAAYLQDVLYSVDWDLEFGKSGMIGSPAYWTITWWKMFNHGDTASEDFTEFHAMEDDILGEFDDAAREEKTDKFIDEYVNTYCLSYPICQDVYTNLMTSSLEGFSRYGEQWNIFDAHFE